MNVIGIGSDNYIVDISGVELANLIGLYGYELQNVKVGTEMKVWEMYKQVKAFNDNKKRLDNIAIELESFTKNLRTLQPIVNVMVGTAKEVK